MKHTHTDTHAESEMQTDREDGRTWTDRLGMENPLEKGSEPGQVAAGSGGHPQATAVPRVTRPQWSP